MPKSKRSKLIHLTPVTKKTRAHTEALFTKIRESSSTYNRILIFRIENMRNTFLKQIRTDLASNSRIFFGKTKVMAKALGTTPDEEVLPGLSDFSKYLKGSVGLCFTNASEDEIVNFFETYSAMDYARAGVVAERDFTVPEGVVYSRGGEVDVEDDVPIEHTFETSLRANGMPTRLVKGKVMLDGEFEVCRVGQVLNSHQTALLKTFGVTMAEFRVQLLAIYDCGSQVVRELDGGVDDEGGSDVSI